MHKVYTAISRLCGIFKQPAINIYSMRFAKNVNKKRLLHKEKSKCSSLFALIPSPLFLPPAVRMLPWRKHRNHTGTKWREYGLPGLRSSYESGKEPLRQDGQGMLYLHLFPRWRFEYSKLVPDDGWPHSQAMCEEKRIRRKGFLLLKSITHFRRSRSRRSHWQDGWSRER